MLSLSAIETLLAPLRLDAATRLPRPLTAIPPEQWPALLTHADRHSLTPLLADVWQTSGELAALPPDLTRRVTRARTDNATRNGHIRTEFIEITQLLTQATVPHLVLKGWPLVERLYSDPAHRVLYDHDFLIPADHAHRGQQALLAAGLRPLPARDAWTEKHLPPLWRNEGYQWDGYLFDPLYPRPVELHTQLWETGWRGLAVRPLPDPWRGTQTRAVAGHPTRLLGEAETLLHLAMHFAGHLVEREARLNQLLDLARFSAQWDAHTDDWERVVKLAEAANLSRFVYASLSLAHEIFGAPLPPAEIWHRLTRLTPARFRQWQAHRGVMDVLTNDYRRRAKGLDYQLTFLAARSPLEALGVVRFALVPPLGQLQAKYGVAHRWQAALLWPVYLTERALTYGRSLFL